jgi:hypothetical protein
VEIKWPDLYFVQTALNHLINGPEFQWLDHLITRTEKVWQLNGSGIRMSKFWISTVLPDLLFQNKTKGPVYNLVLFFDIDINKWQACLVFDGQRNSVARFNA